MTTIDHILSTASFIDAEARAECERRIQAAIADAKKAEREACARIITDHSIICSNDGNVLGKRPKDDVHALEYAAALLARKP